MARSNALGSWLNESKKKDTRRQRIALSTMDRHKLSRELRWWTVRGALWVTTLLAAVSTDAFGVYLLSERSCSILTFYRREFTAAMGRLTLPERGLFIPVLPLLTLLSILWTAWLPTYSHFRRAELQGRKVRMRGRERYIVSPFPVEKACHHPSAHSISSLRFYRLQCGQGECSQQA